MFLQKAVSVILPVANGSHCCTKFFLKRILITTFLNILFGRYVYLYLVISMSVHFTQWLYNYYFSSTNCNTFHQETSMTVNNTANVCNYSKSVAPCFWYRCDAIHQL